MAKSKNHTNANQVAKAHKKGGIKRPQRQRYPSLSQVNQKYKRNLRRTRLFDPSIKKSVNLAKKIAQKVQDKAKIQAAIKKAIVKKQMRK